jgi:hypothetical protein
MSQHLSNCFIKLDVSKVHYKLPPLSDGISTHQAQSHLKMSTSLMNSDLPPITLEWSSKRLHLRNDAEDWTGKTSSKERRKLQNRLNQRARS